MIVCICSVYMREQQQGINKKVTNSRYIHRAQCKQDKNKSITQQYSRQQASYYQQNQSKNKLFHFELQTMFNPFQQILHQNILQADVEIDHSIEADIERLLRDDVREEEDVVQRELKRLGQMREQKRRRRRHMGQQIMLFGNDTVRVAQRAAEQQLVITINDNGYTNNNSANTGHLHARILQLQQQNTLLQLQLQSFSRQQRLADLNQPILQSHISSSNYEIKINNMQERIILLQKEILQLQRVNSDMRERFQGNYKEMAVHIGNDPLIRLIEIPLELLIQHHTNSIQQPQPISQIIQKQVLVQVPIPVYVKTYKSVILPKSSGSGNMRVNSYNNSRYYEEYQEKYNHQRQRVVNESGCDDDDGNINDMSQQQCVEQVRQMRQEQQQQDATSLELRSESEGNNVDNARNNTMRQTKINNTIAYMTNHNDRNVQYALRTHHNYQQQSKQQSTVVNRLQRQIRIGNMCKSIQSQEMDQQFVLEDWQVRGIRKHLSTNQHNRLSENNDSSASQKGNGNQPNTLSNIIHNANKSPHKLNLTTMNIRQVQSGIMLSVNESNSRLHQQQQQWKEIIEVPVYIIKEVPQRVVEVREIVVQKQVVRYVEVPVETVVEVQVQVQVERIVQVKVQRLVEVPIQVQTIKQVPIQVIRLVQVPVQIQRIKQVIVQVQVQVQVEKIVYIQKLIQFPVQIQTIMQVPVEVEIPKLLEVPVQVQMHTLPQRQQIVIQHPPVVIQKVIIIESPVEVQLQKKTVQVQVQVQSVILMQVPVELSTTTTNQVVQKMKGEQQQTLMLIELTIALNNTQTTRLIEMPCPQLIQTVKLIEVPIINELLIERVVERIIQVQVQKIVQVQKLIQVQVQRIVFIHQLIQLPIVVEVTKLIQLPVQVNQTVVQFIEVPVQVVKQIVVKQSIEVVKQVVVVKQTLVELPVEIINQVILETVQEVPYEIVKQVPCQIVKQVPVEIIKYVTEVQFVEVPVEVQVTKQQQVALIEQKCQYRVLLIQVPTQVPVIQQRVLLIEKPVQIYVVKEVPFYIETVREVVKLVQVPVQVEKTVEVPVEVMIEVPAVVELVEVSVENVIETERIVEVPVDRIVQKIVEVEKIVQVIRQVVKVIQVQRQVQKIIEVQVEKIIQVQVQKLIYQHLPVYISTPAPYQVSKVIQIQVQKIIYKQIPIQVVRQVQVQRIVQVPGPLKFVEVKVPIYIEKVVEKVVEVPIYIDREVERVVETGEKGRSCRNIQQEEGSPVRGRQYSPEKGCSAQRMSSLLQSPQHQLAYPPAFHTLSSSRRSQTSQLSDHSTTNDQQQRMMLTYRQNTNDQHFFSMNPSGGLLQQKQDNNQQQRQSIIMRLQENEVRINQENAYLREKMMVLTESIMEKDEEIERGKMEVRRLKDRLQQEEGYQVENMRQVAMYEDTLHRQLAIRKQFQHRLEVTQLQLSQTKKSRNQYQHQTQTYKLRFQQMQNELTKMSVQVSEKEREMEFMDGMLRERSAEIGEVNNLCSLITQQLNNAKVTQRQLIEHNHRLEDDIIELKTIIQDVKRGNFQQHYDDIKQKQAALDYDRQRLNKQRIQLESMYRQQIEGVLTKYGQLIEENKLQIAELQRAIQKLQEENKVLKNKQLEEKMKQQQQMQQQQSLTQKPTRALTTRQQKAIQDSSKLTRIIQVLSRENQQLKSDIQQLRQNKANNSLLSSGQRVSLENPQQQPHLKSFSFSQPQQQHINSTKQPPLSQRQLQNSIKQHSPRIIIQEIKDIEGESQNDQAISKLATLVREYQLEMERKEGDIKEMKELLCSYEGVIEKLEREKNSVYGNGLAHNDHHHHPQSPRLPDSPPKPSMQTSVYISTILRKLSLCQQHLNRERGQKLRLSIKARQLQRQLEQQMTRRSSNNVIGEEDDELLEEVVLELETQRSRNEELRGEVSFYKREMSRLRFGSVQEQPVRDDHGMLSSSRRGLFSANINNRPHPTHSSQALLNMQPLIQGSQSPYYDKKTLIQQLKIYKQQYFKVLNENKLLKKRVKQLDGGKSSCEQHMKIIDRLTVQVRRARERVKQLEQELSGCEQRNRMSSGNKMRAGQLYYARGKDYERRACDNNNPYNKMKMIRRVSTQYPVQSINLQQPQQQQSIRRQGSTNQLSNNRNQPHTMQKSCSENNLLVSFINMSNNPKPQPPNMSKGNAQRASQPIILTTSHIDANLNTIINHHQLPFQVKYILTIKLLEFALQRIDKGVFESICPQTIYILRFNVNQLEEMKVTRMVHHIKGRDKLYQAPEIIVHNQKQSEVAYVWTVGLIVDFIFHQKPYYQRMADVIAKQENYKFISNQAQNIAQIVEHMVVKQPSRRISMIQAYQHVLNLLK